MSESPADRRSEEYSSVLCRLLEEQDDEMEQRVWQPLNEATFRVADDRGWPIERHGDIGNIALFMGHRMGGEDEQYAMLMVRALRGIQDNFFQQIYDGSEMDSYEQMAKEMVAFLKRADRAVPHDGQTPRDWMDKRRRA